MFLVITQPRDDTVAFTPSEAVSTRGEFVISLYILEQEQANADEESWSGILARPMAERRFYDGDRNYCC